MKKFKDMSREEMLEELEGYKIAFREEYDSKRKLEIAIENQIKHCMVKIFTSPKTENLEKYINDFIQDREIKDIKFSEDTAGCMTAMVIFYVPF